MTAMPAELAQILAEIVPDGGRFGHRQHVQLAFAAARRFGTQRGTELVGQWIRHLAAYEHAPQKYHATMTRAWAEIVGHHAELDPGLAEFAAFAERYPALLDKRLLMRHYTSATLASGAARAGWVPPDREPFPWSGEPA